jgi:aldehyde dehydrogenase (NAD+)
MGFVTNSGQVCLAGTRLLVQRGIHERFCELLAQAIGKIRVGVDEPFPTLGPLANRAQYQKVLGYFDLARREGARVLAGGEPATGGSLADGLYVKPTLYGGVHNDMRIAREEIFGPVGVVIPFDSEDDAIRMANDTEYGLAAGIWTSNLSRAHRVAAQLQAGQVYVNHYQDAGVEQPMGGYKTSGIGREKGMVALQQYTQLKNVSVRLI